MQKAGIIGDGQLAQMLILASRDLNLNCVYFGESASPAGLLQPPSSTNQIGELKGLAIENEFFDSNFSEQKHLLLPSYSAIELFRDKLQQKLFFQKHDFPTAPFLIRENNEEPRSFVTRSSSDFPQGFVLKWSLYGYDGKGNYVVNSEQDFESAVDFIKMGSKRGAQTYAEALISFEKELAQVSVVSADGKELIHYPLVQTVQKNGACFLVEGGESVQQDLLEPIKMAQKLMEKLVGRANISGALAIEFFLTSKNELLINEVAPRVHNSGHWTQLLNNNSQFHQHIRVLFRQAPKPLVNIPRFFGMRNLLAEVSEKIDLTPKVAHQVKCDGVYVSLYGKDKLTPHRKMGHINYQAETRVEFDRLKSVASKLETSLWQRAQEKGDFNL